MIKNAFGSNDDSFATAKFLGTLRASSSPIQLKYKGKLNKNDTVDFFRLDIAPGAAFATLTGFGNVRGGRLQVNSFVGVGGAAPIKSLSLVYNPGPYTESSSTPFVNNLSSKIQLYIEVRSLSNSKKIVYKATSFFNP